jgi:hypothetical protein
MKGDMDYELEEWFDSLDEEPTEEEFEDFLADHEGEFEKLEGDWSDEDKEAKGPKKGKKGAKKAVARFRKRKGKTQRFRGKGKMSEESEY